MNDELKRKSGRKNPPEGEELFRVVERAKREWERTFDVIPDLIAIIGNDCRIVRADRGRVCGDRGWGYRGGDGGGGSIPGL
ncbi:MAG: hypothetical protein P9M08_11975 [Candidatus Erginobacter occultus]|nr:hypothetical protein [Candidatus Erginobacter occultus]